MQEVGAAHRDGVESHLVRHLIEQAFEREAHVDRAVAAKGAARRRVGEHTLADVFDVAQVVDRVEHRTGVENRHHAVARMCAAALGALTLDAGDAAVLAQADLESDIGFRAPAVRDEGFLAVDHEAHAAASLAREQRSYQFDVERLGAAAEAATDMRLDHADARHVHAENLRQHEVDVIRHLRRGVDGDAIAHRVVVGERGMHLHLVLAHLGAIVGTFAHQIGARKGSFDITELKENVALDIVCPALVNVDRHPAPTLRGRCDKPEALAPSA